MMDSGSVDDHPLDRPVNARIIRGNGGNGRNLGNGVGGIGPSTSSSRNPPRQQEREHSPENSASYNNLKRKREVLDRVLKYAKDRYEKRDECVPFSLRPRISYSREYNVSLDPLTESPHPRLPL